MILVSVLVLGVLVFVHELGHFLLAKWNGVGVLEFAVGFGKKIWKRRIGETTYAIGLIPLGGYVRMVGDDPRSIDKGKDEPTEEKDADVLPLDEKDRALLADRNKWFLEKGYLAKCAIVLAGPGFNILFALILSIAALLIYGEPDKVTDPVIREVEDNYPAAKAGLMARDRVISIDGRPISTWEELVGSITASEGKELALEVERKNAESGALERKTLRMSAKPDVELAEFLGEEAKAKPPLRIGITGDFQYKPVSVGEAFTGGFERTWFSTKLVVFGVWRLISGKAGVDNIRGPIFIFKETANQAERGLDGLFSFVIFLSISLAIMNLLPIPVLDGGHLLMFTIGLLKGGPISVRVQEIATQVGILLLLLLMVFAVGNDIHHIFFK